MFHCNRIAELVVVSVTCSFALPLLLLRYKAFRDETGKYTLVYWELLAVRLGFIIAFEVQHMLSMFYSFPHGCFSSVDTALSATLRETFEACVVIIIGSFSLSQEKVLIP